MIREAISARLVDLHTAMPGRVESYDATTQTADIQPQLKRVVRKADGTRVAEDLPVIPSVPVQWPRAGGFFLTMPLTAGDFGMLIFSEYSLDRWRSQGEQVDPADTRRHGLSGAVFAPGIHPTDQPLADASATRLVLGSDGDTGLDMDTAAIRLGKAAATEGIGLGAALQTFLGSLKTYLDTHAHTGVTTGPGTSGPPAPSPAVPTVASSKHLVEP